MHEMTLHITTLKPERIGHHFADHILTRIFMWIRNTAFQFKLYWSLYRKFQLNSLSSSVVHITIRRPQATSHYRNQCWQRSVAPYGALNIITNIPHLLSSIILYITDLSWYHKSTYATCLSRNIKNNPQHNLMSNHTQTYNRECIRLS